MPAAGGVKGRGKATGEAEGELVISESYPLNESVCLNRASHQVGWFRAAALKGLGFKAKLASDRRERNARVAEAAKKVILNRRLIS